MKLLKEDKIHLLGSDCHNMTSRMPNLGDGAERLRQKLDPELAEEILQRGMKLI